jgi:hypothetical protein
MTMENIPNDKRCRKCFTTPCSHKGPCANSHCLSVTGSVFELVDCTNEEAYYPMGLFLSLEDALDQVKDREEPPTDDPEEYVKMEVRERQVGKLRYWDNGKTVATIQWIQDYIEAKEDWVWHKPSISLPNTETTQSDK